MQELLPIVFGAIASAAVSHIPLSTPRLPWFVFGCIAAGALASWINGELQGSLWMIFISFDALLAWLGAIGYAGALRALRAMQQT